MATSITVLALLVFAVFLLAVDGTTEQRTETFRDVEAVILDLDNADVELVAGGPEAVVQHEIRTGRFGGRASTEVRDGTLHVTYDCPWFDVSLFGLGCSGEYRIAVPPDTGITGHSGNGELRVTGLDGPLDLRTSNGDIHLDGTAGPIEVHTSNGQVTGAELVSAQLQATTSNGEVVVGFATAPDDVLIDTSNGSVEVVVPDDGGPWAVDPSTSNGDVTTDVTTDPDAPRRLVLRTSNGDILVRTD